MASLQEKITNYFKKPEEKPEEAVEPEILPEINVKTVQQSLGEFRRHAGQLAHSDRYGFEIRFKKRNTSFPLIEPPEAVYLLCQGINFPPIALQTKQMRWDEGPFFNRPQGIDVGGEAITFDFTLDVDLTARQFFEAWVNLIFNADDATVRFPETYMHDIYIYNLDVQDNPRQVVQLIDAYPRIVAMVPFSATGSNTPATLNVTFTYHTVKTYQLGHLWEKDRSRAGSLLDRLGFDFSKFSNPEAYLQKALGYFASLNPTVYNIYAKFPSIKV